MTFDTFCIQGAFVLPLLLLLVLGYLGLRLPLWAVLVWALIYGGVILILLLCKTRETVTEPMLLPYVRTATFLRGGVVAAVMAGRRTQLEKSYNSLLQVLSSLPYPVVVSDISGAILLINNAAEKLIENPTNDLSGLSYFSTFANPSEQGQSIARYLGYFNTNDAGPHRMMLHTRGKNQMTLTASLTIVETTSQQLAVTIVESVSPSPQPQ